MLIGEYIHTLDDKNRVSLPVKFRKEIGKNLILVPWFDNCIALFTEKEWAKMSSKLSEASFIQSDNRSFNRFMFGGASEASVDSIGRILVPDFLKDRSELKGKVALVGVSNRVELWNPEKWQEYKKVVEEKADSLAEKLGSVGVL